MRPGDGGVAAAVTNINVLPLFSRAEQLSIPVHVSAFRCLSLDPLPLSFSQDSQGFLRSI